MYECVLYNPGLEQGPQPHGACVCVCCAVQALIRGPNLMERHLYDAAMALAGQRDVQLPSPLQVLVSLIASRRLREWRCGAGPVMLAPCPQCVGACCVPQKVLASAACLKMCWRLLRASMCWRLLRALMCWHLLRASMCWRLLRTSLCWRLLRALNVLAPAACLKMCWRLLRASKCAGACSVPAFECKHRSTTVRHQAPGD